MGCSGSKDSDRESTQQEKTPQPAYGTPQYMVPPTTLPQGWISQYDSSKQRLYYVYPQTGQVTWEHPLGPQADTQEMARFHQIQQQQQTIYTSNPKQGSFTDNYNRQGGMGTGAGIVMGMLAGGAMGIITGSLLSDSIDSGVSNDVFSASTDYSPSGDIFSACTDYSGGDLVAGGGGEYVSTDYGF
ncbi:hypothetical protein BGX26_002000 [Mortierella sp. AD094]|nr:hypothetical protein BGX26_002000 [Mortierella sp. AD094]